MVCLLGGVVMPRKDPFRAVQSTCCSMVLGSGWVSPPAARHPDTVIGVGGQQSYEGRCWMFRVAYRDMQLVRGHNVQPWITILPPKLAPNGNHLNGVCGSRGLLHGGNHSHCRHE